MISKSDFMTRSFLTDIGTILNVRVNTNKCSCFRGSSGIGTVVSSFKDLMLDDEKSEVKLPPSAAQSSSPPTSGRGDYFSLR